MHTLTRCIVLLSVVACLAGFTTGAFGSEPVKIKGFFIGMTIDDALTNFQRLGFEDLNIRENTYRKTNTYYSIRPGSGDPFKVETGFNSRAVSLIYFSGPISDRLFRTKEIGAEIVRDRFIQAYEIPGMVPYKDNPGTDAIKGWEYYNLADGFRIRIFLNKDIEIVKTDRADDFAFD